MPKTTYLSVLCDCIPDFEDDLTEEQHRAVTRAVEEAVQVILTRDQPPKKWWRRVTGRVSREEATRPATSKP